MSLTGCTAGYVTERPADVTYVRPVSPGPGYVWINGEWEYSGNNYHWREGSWQHAQGGPNMEIRILGKQPQRIQMA